MFLDYVYKHVYSIDSYFYIPNESTVNKKISEFIIESRIIIILFTNMLKQ